MPKVFFSLTRQSLYIYIYSYNTIIGIYYLLETEKYSKGVAGMGFSSKSSSPGDRLLFQILGMMEPPWRDLLGKWKEEVNTGCGRGELQTVPVTREHTCFYRKRQRQQQNLPNINLSKYFPNYSRLKTFLFCIWNRANNVLDCCLVSYV